MTKPMTKSELVEAISNEMGGQTKSLANSALDAMAAVIAREVSAGRAITIPGIGKIHAVDRPARMVRNPSTGEAFQKDADKAVKFTAAKALKDSVNS
ncbi:MAG: HU family DNA-binding protein [Roseovarius sp.]|nr:HU family DNA-binding protein [Roseovarius sp.]MCY4209427.1 HU family DNA-binding protein [Roseovarius sp.]MCY4291405.1 HU family DNA-binding protein [Roseovarius sp.]MCY4314946.1 HU family DNA-binding protein [Roseovarius sp.]